MDALQQSENEAAAVAVAPRVTLDYINKHVIVSEHYFTAAEGHNGAAMAFAMRPDAPEPLKLLTFCVLVLRNGVTVTGESACAHPGNFDATLGKKIAREAAVRKVWAFEGYLLHEQLAHSNVGDNPATGMYVGQPIVGESTDAEVAARIAHEVNRAWCEFNGDTSQPTWDNAPEWQRQSAVNGYRFHLDNPEAGDDASHNSWMAEKVAAGWVYGQLKDPEATPPTHPCLVPFDQLPREQQFKDRLFRTIVRAALAR